MVHFFLTPRTGPYSSDQGSPLNISAHFRPDHTGDPRSLGLSPPLETPTPPCFVQRSTSFSRGIRDEQLVNCIERVEYRNAVEYFERLAPQDAVGVPTLPRHLVHRCKTNEVIGCSKIVALAVPEVVIRGPKQLLIRVWRRRWVTVSGKAQRKEGKRYREVHL